MTNLSNFSKYYRTDNSTAEASDIQQGRTAYLGGGLVTGTLDATVLLYHQFDGGAGTKINNLKPSICYDDTTVFGGADIELDGNGYLTELATGNRFLTIDPSNRWPSRTGKVRHYHLWGRCTGNLVTNDYLPTVRTNYVDSNNFWASRVNGAVGSNEIGVEMYEWISGGLGEGARTAVNTFSTSGAYRWGFHVEDQEDTVIAYLYAQDESAEATDATISQSDGIQLYKSTRDNQDEAQFQVTWEGVREIMEIRGLMVYDSTD